MKKGVSISAIAFAVLFCAWGLSACGGNGGSSGNGGDGGSGEIHTHTAGDYTWDEDLHRQTCTECGETLEEADHVYDGSNTCTLCGYTIVPTEGLEYEQMNEKEVFANGTVEYVPADGYAVTGIGTAGEEAKIVIPAYHDGKPVIQIDDNAFIECNFTEVHIPSTVESILSFTMCNSLTELRIPDSVTWIWHFYGNAALKSVTFGKNSHLIYLGKATFGGCPELVSVNLPDSFRYSEDDLFEKSKILTDKSFWTDGILYIGNHVISADPSLSGVLTIRAGTLSIINSAFWPPCENITEVILPEGLRSINGYAFDTCSALKRVVIPASLEYLGYGAFERCDSLETIEYGGTTEQWKALLSYEPMTRFISDGCNCIVSCTDGTIDMEGNVTKK